MKKQLITVVSEKDQNIRISAFIEDAGPDWVVCLHGLQSNKEQFAKLLQQPFMLQNSKLAIDLIGFGESEKPADFEYTVENQAKVVEILIKSLNIQRLNLIGHSLGGMVSILLLSRLPGIIRSFVNMEGNLILSDCGPSRTVAALSFDEFRISGYQKLKETVNEESPQRAKWLNDIPDFVFYKMSKSIVRLSESNRVLNEFVNASLPRLFLYGDKNLSKARIIPNTITKREIRNSGHFMLLDNPWDCYAAIQDFIGMCQRESNK